MYKNGSDFLNKLYSNMHMEDVVMHTAEKSDTPDEKIGKYLDRLERVHNMAKDEIVILPESYRNKVGCTKAKITYIPDEEYFKEDNLSDMLDSNVDENDENRKLK